jgi:chaperone required for assembly of F1-ATPase
MSEWAPRRFWSAATVERAEGGWIVRLDSRALHTPSKRPLAVPTEAMAAAMADEWEAQGERIDPRTMPVTRAANTAVDKVAPQRNEVVEALAAYAETDLLSYRAEKPASLVARQSAVWDPLLAWAEDAFDARLETVAGVMPRSQPDAAITRLRAEVDRLDPFPLTAMHDLVMLSGSLVLALAVERARLSGAEAWRLSRVDEDWQAEVWGHDDAAARDAEDRREAFLAAERFLALALDRADTRHLPRF